MERFSGSDDVALVALAARGDRAAAGAYFQRNQRLLMAMAHRIGAGVLDADDLLSDALVTVLTKWSQGIGPDRYANAYLIQTMRNRVKDELRSPRSRVGELTEVNAPPHDDGTERRSADMHWEYATVRSALQLVPADQRAVLVATVLEGRRPAELEAELGRPASAIYSLTRRARVNLRRMTLRVVLQDGAPRGCQAAARELPDRIGLSVEDSGESRGMRHIRTCARCRAAWGRFASISLTLGVVTLLSVGGVVLPVSSADASEAGSPSDTVPRGLAGAVSRRGRTRVWGAAMSAIGVLAVAAGTTALAVGVLLTTVIPDSPPDATFEVVSTGSADRGELSVRIHVDRPWTVDRLLVTLPTGSVIEHAPAGWQCSAVSANEIACVTATASAAGGVFVVSSSGVVPADAVYRVELVALADGHTLTAYERGPLVD